MKLLIISADEHWINERAEELKEEGYQVLTATDYASVFSIMETHDNIDAAFFEYWDQTQRVTTKDMLDATKEHHPATWIVVFGCPEDAELKAAGANRFVMNPELVVATIYQHLVLPRPVSS